MKKLFPLVLNLLLLSACASLVEPQIKTSNDVFLRSKVIVDPYEKTTHIMSPGFNNTFLSAIVEDNEIVSYKFCVSDNNQDWKLYNRAHDSTGNRLEFIEVDSRVTSSGRTQERFVIELDRDYLNKAVATGLDIKASGFRGDKIFTLPSYYIEGFLKKVDEYIKGIGPEPDLIRKEEVI